MPSYSSRCEGCGALHPVRLSFSDYDAVKLGVKVLECSTCQGKVVLDFNPGDVTFVLRDGESGGWTSKAMKENKWRSRHREVMAKREKDHVFKSKLVPNFQGEETGTWREAQAVARNEGGSLSASTYEPLVKQERSA